MKPPVLAAACFVAVLGFVPARADEPKPDKEQPVSEISLEVQALRALYTLKLTNEQLKTIAKFAKETAEPERKRTPKKITDEYRKALTNLRDAFLADEDDDKIDELEEELDKIATTDKPELDDSYEVTKGARKRTPEVIKSLTVAQLAVYYGSIAEEVKEPVAQLKAALEEVRRLDKKEYTDKRDEIADDVAWCVAGLDTAKADKVREKVTALLDRVHKLDKDQYQAKKADLEKEAQALVGEVGPDFLLRHYAEHTVADLLSNPKLAAVLKARLK